ncbi:efflux transporter outer membrane subunit [Caulobacter sp. CCNWLY153]|uniref:efflux transporter outer membrane subunit n=1 Tax=unclassified Caulobacter TaxID=2648921 RepID=UPI002FF3E37E
MLRNLTLTLLAASALTACTMAPKYERPALPVATTWPTASANGQTASAGDLAWKQVFEDPRLAGTIDLALANNRDLRVAVLNIEQARATYRIQRAALLPTVNGTLSGTRSSTPVGASAFPISGVDSLEVENYNANVGVTSYELDIFGRVRSLKDQALHSYLATEETARATQISLIAETANAWLTLAADQDLLALAKDTLKSREDSLALAQRQFDVGAASQLDLRTSQTLAETARADVATYTAQVERDRNALRLLVGTEVPADLQPAGGLITAQILPDLPAGVASDVLTRRPDVLAAEHSLMGANANIGAARAAFFPRISLTGSYGSASADLDGLFKGGTKSWSFAPSISVPIFAGGANKAGLDSAKAGQKIAVATYEKTVQTAFREVSDALATQATIGDRLAAQERVAAAAADTARLTKLRYDRGVDSSLILLDAQRTQYSAQQGLINARLARASNLVTLYKVLGGGAPASKGS